MIPTKRLVAKALPSAPSPFDTPSIPSRHTHVRHGRRRRTPLIRALLFLTVGALIFVFLLFHLWNTVRVKAGLPPGVNDVLNVTAIREREGLDPRIGIVTSLHEVRYFCEKNAPELAQASWSRAGATSLSFDLSGRNAWYGNISDGNSTYGLVPGPVCVDQEGRVFLDEDHYAEGENNFTRYATFPTERLDDSVFARRPPGQHVEVIPALGILARTRWIDTHLWHLFRDCMSALTTLVYTYNHRELFRVPTQTVLLYMPGASWVDRYGNTDKRREFSRWALNSLSSALRGGPFFKTAPVFRIESQKSWYEFFFGRAPPPPGRHLQCYCQAMEAHKVILIHNVDSSVFYGMQDMIARQSSEDDYMTGYSPAVAVQRRLASHPWAARFWAGDAFTRDGEYKPRALVIHRESRLIGNVRAYVERLRELDFNVQEVYPERLSVEQQYHVGRHADVILGMHGVGLSHGFWMDRFPIGCRAVVEFRPWVVRQLPLDLERILSWSMHYDFHAIWPVDVVFGDKVKDHAEARQRLLLPEHVREAFRFVEFTDQTAVYNDTEVFATFANIRAHLRECLAEVQTVPRVSPIFSEEVPPPS